MIKSVIAAAASILILVGPGHSGEANVTENRNVTSHASTSITAEEEEKNEITVTFPARTDELTKYNKDIFSIEPFETVIVLPDGWTISEKGEGDTKFPISGAWSSMGIYTDDGTYAGAIAYNIYEEYEGVEEWPQAIYNQIDLGNGYHFEAHSEYGYSPVTQTESGVTAVTKVYISKQVSAQWGYGDGSTEIYTHGILSYNKDFHVYIACEFDPALVSNQELAEIAGSIVIRKAQSDNTPQIKTNVNECTEYDSVYCIHYNTKDILGVEPFETVIALPHGWTIDEKGEGDTKFPIAGAWSSMGIYTDDGTYAGAIAYNIYEEYEGAEDVPQAIYNQIALGNGYQFDAYNKNVYSPVTETESGVTAVTKVYISKYMSAQCGYGDGSTETTTQGILSYNKDLHVYIACELDPELISDEMLTEIAKSVKIRKS